MDKKAILLIEDTPDDEKLITMSLKKSNIGNDLVVVRDGQEAVDYLFGRGPHAGRDAKALPTVVLLDLKLPKIDGLDVLRMIRADERTKLLPVVILTSSDEERDRVESYNLGANSYVRKPIDFAEFAEAVKKLGLYWLILNRTAQG